MLLRTRANVNPLPESAGWRGLDEAGRSEEWCTDPVGELRPEASIFGFQRPNFSLSR
jgi:hypothetical protein